MKTNKIKAVLGFYPGYGYHPVDSLDDDAGEDIIKIVGKEYQRIAEKNFQEYLNDTGKEVYISAVITKSNTVYRESWGCPEKGETTITIECTRNPKFIEDAELYKRLATKNITDLQTKLKQCTVLIEYLDLDCIYIS
jgi:hypothetical protein